MCRNVKNLVYTYNNLTILLYKRETSQIQYFKFYSIRVTRIVSIMEVSKSIQSGKLCSVHAMD